MEVVSDMSTCGVGDVPGASTLSTYGTVIPGPIVEFLGFIRVVGFLTDSFRKIVIVIAVVAVTTIVWIIVIAMVAITTVVLIIS